MEMKTFLRLNWDRALAMTLVLMGLLALTLGWVGVSGTGLAAEQNPYLISGGLAGVALITLGCTLWVSADLQDEWRRLDALEERLGELVGSASANGSADPAVGGGDERGSRPRARRASVSK